MKKRVEYAKIFVKESGKILLRSLKKENLDIPKIQNKIEAYIIGSIFNRYPIDSISTEKTGEIVKTSNYRWILVPLYGDTDFLEKSFISIKIEEEGVIKARVIYLPLFNELLYQDGDNLFINDEIVLDKEKLINFYLISEYLEKTQWSVKKTILNI